jgi:hypothetical protein
MDQLYSPRHCRAQDIGETPTLGMIERRLDELRGHDTALGDNVDAAMPHRQRPIIVPNSRPMAMKAPTAAPTAPMVASAIRGHLPEVQVIRTNRELM